MNGPLSNGRWLPVDQALLPVGLLVNAVVHRQHHDAGDPEAHRRADYGVRLVHFEFTYLKREIGIPIEIAVDGQLN